MPNNAMQKLAVSVGMVLSCGKFPPTCETVALAGETVLGVPVAEYIVSVLRPPNCALLAGALSVAMLVAATKVCECAGSCELLMVTLSVPSR
jgi:hypothetical protein